MAPSPLPKELVFENAKNNTLTAYGFGDKGQDVANADLLTFCYDADKGMLRMNACRSDPLLGQNAECEIDKGPMSVGKAMEFANIVNAAVTALIAEKDPSATTFNDLKTSEGELLNRNALKEIMNRAVHAAERTVAGCDAEVLIKSVLAVSLAVDVGEYDGHEAYLDDTLVVSPKGNPAKVVYVDQDGKQVWDPSLDEGDGAWVQFKEKHAPQDVMAYVAKSLDLEKEMGPTLGSHRAADAMHEQLTGGNRTTVSLQKVGAMLLGEDVAQQTSSFDAGVNTSSLSSKQKRLARLSLAI